MNGRKNERQPAEREYGTGDAALRCWKHFAVHPSGSWPFHTEDPPRPPINARPLLPYFGHSIVSELSGVLKALVNTPISAIRLSL